ncbi:MAG: transporter substrate-binding domain-containing protein [Leptolyngbyaceae cyanobacterium SM2_5_2]|nr:transporter substrate-binding domain-containing protein [Leptolyngbyaceae cyanobacterium SM2_5_2]
MRWALFSLGMVLGVQLAVPPISVAADLETIEARGYLVVAVRDGWRPLSFRDQSENLVGLEIDIARQLATEIFADPNAVVFQVVTNTERLSTILKDQADVAIAGLTITPSRMRLVNFSPPYYLDGAGILVPEGRFQSLQDIQRRRIGVLQDSSTIPSVRYLLPVAELVPFTSYQAAYSSLSSGQIEAFAGDVTVLVGWQQEVPGYQLIPELLSADPLAVVMPKGNQYSSLRALVENALTTWHETGWLEERATFWGLP